MVVVDAVETEPIEVVEAVEEVEVVEAREQPARPARVKKTVNKPQKNVWDSYRILGTGMAVSLLLVALFFLVYYFMRGSAEENIARADSAYETRSYETAAEMYSEFANSFPTHEKASYAKVRNALALLRKDVENAPDPSIGLKTAQMVLPGIVSEEGLSRAAFRPCGCFG